MNLLMIILIVASILAFALARPQYPDYKDIDDERFHDERYDDDGTGVVVDKVYATPRPNKHGHHHHHHHKKYLKTNRLERLKRFLRL